MPPSLLQTLKYKKTLSVHLHLNHTFILNKAVVANKDIAVVTFLFYTLQAMKCCHRTPLIPLIRSYKTIYNVRTIRSK